MSSYICKPTDNVALILSHFWTPINITTARESIKKISSSDEIKAILPSGEVVGWEDWTKSNHHYPSQPFLRSSHNIFPVPTILLTSTNWCYRGKDKPTLQWLYSRFKGKCQICGTILPISKMSMEHIFPQSKGGDNGWFNLTISCKKCNSRKSSEYPYKNFNGKELQASKPLPFFHTFMDSRSEWQPFLFKKLPS
jgi:5-methylcytosine-specific restriction endonuclease McrA